MHSFLSSPLMFLTVGITVDKLPELDIHFFTASCFQPYFLHKQYKSGLSELSHSVSHTQKADHLNRHLTYSAQRYSEAAFVRAAAVIIVELSLSAFQSHSSLIIINLGSIGGLHATRVMPHIDLIQI